MKNKLIKFFGIMLTSSTILFSSCDMIFDLPSLEVDNNSISNGSNNTNSNNGSIRLNVYDGDSLSVYFVQQGQNLKLNEYTKEGYGCKGVFDTREGGTKYFYSDGSPVSAWKTTNPTNLYVQWESIYNIVETNKSNNSFEFSYYKGINIAPKSTTRASNAIKANKSKTLKVSLSFYAYEDSGEDWVVYIKHADKYSEGSLTAKQIASKYSGIIIEPPTSSKKYTMSNTFQCRDVNQSGLYLWVTRGATWGEGVISDFEITYSFQ